MNKFARSPWLVGVAGPLLAAVVGCAGLKVPDGLPQDVAPQRKARNELAIRDFEAKRDFAQFQAAAARWDQNDAKGCREELDLLLKRRPDHCDARLLLADVLLSEDRYPEALQEVQQALAAHPNEAKVQYAMGLMLDGTARSAEAVAYYARAAELEPGNELYACGYRTARDAAGRYATGAAPAAPDATATATAAAYAAPPEQPYGWAVACSADESLPAAGGPAAPSELRFRPEAGANDIAGGSDSADSADSSLSRALLEKGREALDKGSWEAAMAYFREASERSPSSPQIPIAAATMALRYNRPDLAVGLLVAVGPRFPDSAAMQRVLGVAYYRQGNYPSSEVALQQALSLDRSSSLTYFLLGCTLAKLGQVESAEAHFQQARTLDPRFAQAR